ncbi:hypothetical protein PVL30_002017 [Lodderomyces elongisporus]|uniref:uncharacterized protein n=1 Tax=Lodderomyces elongisporus TaxID=36914 RepID=UPI0029245D73|nr:uncharacterized protein PVL30_002017 [Lodderomyces elongisporus]WLF78283.1 hypothetical protein PVL30_002017 [Lodderomyces elongisporus]
MIHQTRLRIIVRQFSLKTNGSNFHLPKDYKPNKVIKTLPLSRCAEIWWKSLSKNRTSELQKELVDLMIPNTDENAGIIKDHKLVVIDQEEKHHINEVGFRIENDADLPTKHLVFIHGYGASLGCFARNFQIINKFKSSTQYNYHVHFLDNITFGLSSNPKIANDTISWKIPSTASIKMIDHEDPQNPKKLYKKYYKLIDGYQLDPANFQKYQKLFKPILEDMEDFYSGAIDKWRQASGIEQIDFLIGHSYGAYWSGSYALRNPDNVRNLILLSPVGVERHVMAITNDTVTSEVETPTLDPTSYKFLSRFPVLSKDHILKWYYKIPFLPRILPFLGPWGVKLYFGIWLSKLSKINKLVAKHGGAEAIYKNSNDLVYGTKREIELIVEYLYNSTTHGSHSDIYVKYLLTPATVSKWPLYDKFITKLENKPSDLRFNLFVFYGEYDFMNSEAGEKLLKKLNQEGNTEKVVFKYGEIAEGGHNLYIDNPFDTNEKIYEIAKNEEHLEEKS